MCTATEKNVQPRGPRPSTRDKAISHRPCKRIGEPQCSDRKNRDHDLRSQRESASRAGTSWPFTTRGVRMWSLSTRLAGPAGPAGPAPACPPARAQLEPRAMKVAPESMLLCRPLSATTRTARAARCVRDAQDATWRQPGQPHLWRATDAPRVGQRCRGRRLAIGREISNRAPVPSPSLWPSSCPLWAAMIALAMVSPMPLPEPFAVREESPR